jgi:hypothetical protein
MKRVALGTVVAVAFALGTTVSAGGSGATKDSHPVSFTLTSSGCANLPPGTVITGSGIEQSVTETQVDSDGVARMVNSTQAKGTAFDQDGNRYVFTYANESRLSNSVASPDVFSGDMTDSFSLAGNGPAGLHNGFNAFVTLDFSTFAFSAQPRSSRGDPIDFATGAAHCDPL